MRAPPSRKSLRPFGGHEDTVMGAGKMESQALGLGHGVGRDPREKIELGIELGHIDLDGCVVRLGGVSLGLELGAFTVQPWAGFLITQTLEAEPRR